MGSVAALGSGLQLGGLASNIFGNFQQAKEGAAQLQAQAAFEKDILTMRILRSQEQESLLRRRQSELRGRQIVNLAAQGGGIGQSGLQMIAEDQAAAEREIAGERLQRDFEVRNRQQRIAGLLAGAGTLRSPITPFAQSLPGILSTGGSLLTSNLSSSSSSLGSVGQSSSDGFGGFSGVGSTDTRGFTRA